MHTVFHCYASSHYHPTGSHEGHTAYLYKCTHAKAKKAAAKSEESSVTMNDLVQMSDPLFREGFEVLAGGRAGLVDWIGQQQAKEEEAASSSNKYAGRLRRRKPKEKSDE